MIRVVNVFDLMKAGRFVRHQECNYLKYPDASNMVVLISHRWNRPENPDPSTIQYHGAVRFVIQLCMMVDLEYDLTSIQTLCPPEVRACDAVRWSRS